jgi:hypothetical protein
MAPWRYQIWHDVRVTGFLIEKDCSAASADSETVQRLLEKGELLWLDRKRWLTGLVFRRRGWL